MFWTGLLTWLLWMRLEEEAALRLVSERRSMLEAAEAELLPMPPFLGIV